MAASIPKNWLHLYQGHEKTFRPGDLVLDATVVHGFNRGSKDLGFPTANLNMVTPHQSITITNPNLTQPNPT